MLSDLFLPSPMLSIASTGRSPQFFFGCGVPCNSLTHLAIMQSSWFMHQTPCTLHHPYGDTLCGLADIPLGHDIHPCSLQHPSLLSVSPSNWPPLSSLPHATLPSKSPVFLFLHSVSECPWHTCFHSTATSHNDQEPHLLSLTTTVTAVMTLPVPDHARGT